MTGPAEVFVSYKSEDRARLKPLVSALEAEGFSVWWDAHIGGGTNWQKDIEQHLDAARCVIVAWTKRSVGDEGHFVRDEARRAQRRGAYLPVCLDAVEPPLGFGEIQALPLNRWRGDRADPRFRALVDAVRACQSGQQSAAPRIHAREPLISRRAVIGGGIGTAVVAGVGGWALLRPSSGTASNRIAVMSFNNMSGDPAQAYFSDGIAEELRGALSRVGLQVIGRASCEAVKELAIPEAAAKLGVAHILTGSVRRSPETIRIGAQLVNGRNGVEEWAQNYDRAPGDAIKIQTDIAAEVAGSLSVALGAAKKAVLTLGGTADAGAQDLYLQATALYRSADGPETRRQVIGLYDAAIARDANYGDAHLAKASASEAFGVQHATTPTELAQWLGLSEQSARRAAELMPGSARVAATFASISSDRLDFSGALRGFNKALGSNPDDAGVLAKALDIVPWLVDDASFLPLADRLVALDPLNPAAHVLRGSGLFTLRRYQDAIASYTRALALAPQRNAPKLFTAMSLLLLDRAGEAQGVIARMPPDDFYAKSIQAIVLARSGDRPAAAAALARFKAEFGESGSYQSSQIDAQMGELEDAFASLDKAVALRDPGLVYLKRDPFLDPIRGDARYAALLTRLNFP